MNSSWNGFFCGIALYCGLQMFTQDLIGKEKYMAMIDAGWVEMSPFWGLGLVALASFLMFMANKEKAK